VETVKNNVFPNKSLKKKQGRKLADSELPNLHRRKKKVCTKGEGIRERCTGRLLNL